jgi:hypothetical protein
MHHSAPGFHPGEDEPESSAGKPIGQQVVGSGVDDDVTSEPELEERHAVPHRSVPGEGLPCHVERDALEVVVAVARRPGPDDRGPVKQLVGARG